MYYRKGMIEQFTELLTEALKEEAQDRHDKYFLFSDEQQRIKAINAFASH